MKASLRALALRHSRQTSPVMDSSKRKRMSGIIVEEAKQTPVEEQRMEFVDRKGIGHPYSICDAIMENVSIALCSEYLAAFGRILTDLFERESIDANDTSVAVGYAPMIETEENRY